MKTILVTGATGEVGSHFVPRLLQRGNNVRLLVRRAEQAEAFRKLGAEVIVGDLSQPESLASAVAGVQTRRGSGRPMRMVLWLWQTLPFPQGLSVLSSPARTRSMVQIIIGPLAKMTSSGHYSPIRKARSRQNRRCWNYIAHEGWACVSCG
jgi:NAD(P)-dependent dehydrogenase (short-subunit alcohol dehydrogenase family)